MLLLLIPMIVLAFLAVGALVYAICLLLPTPARRYALSAALWCAVFGPTLIAFALVGLTALFGVPAATPLGQLAAHHLTPIFYGWSVLALLASAAVASLLAVAHQALIHRMTFALFRWYATAVATGVGTVIVLAAWVGLGIFGVAATPHFFVALLALVLLPGGLGWVSYTLASGLRGQRPERFCWVTSDEFYGRTM